MSSKAEYLKRYLSSDGDQEKKRKKKKNTEKSSGKYLGMRVVEDDAFISVESAKVKEVASDEEREEIEVLKESIKKAKFNPGFKKTFAEVQVIKQEVKSEIVTPDNSPPRRKRNNSNGNDSPPRNQLKIQGHDNDNSPPRRNRNEEISSLKITRKRHDSDNSPPRNSRKRHDSDNSPPRNTRKRHDSDNSPPRNTRKRHDSDNSPPRNNRKRHDSDNSPPRNSRKRHDSDNSPPRNTRKRHDSDNSPPRNNRKRHDSDNSPPRNSRKRHDSDNSPPRKKANNTDSSSIRKRNSKENYGKQKGRYNDSDSDKSPPRRKGKDSTPPKHRRIENPEKIIKEDPDSDTEMKTLEGKKAGLQSAKDLKVESDLIREKNSKMFDEMDSSVSGRYADTVYRKKQTRKPGKDSEEQREKKEREAKKTEELKEKYKDWNRGIAQMENRKQTLEEMARVAAEPLTRHRNDEEMNRHLKEVLHEMDPMANMIKQKRRNNAIDRGELVYPTYLGTWVPNRFNIPPGYRWDGVDRSNGFEGKLARVANQKAATQSEYYKSIAEYE